MISGTCVMAEAVWQGLEMSAGGSPGPVRPCGATLPTAWAPSLVKPRTATPARRLRRPCTDQCH